MIGKRGQIEGCDRLGRDPLALHLVHQIGQTVGQIVDRTARRKIGLPVEQARHKLRQLEPAA